MLDAIGIITRDVPQALRFYAMLGVELNQAGDHDHYEAATPSGVRLMLDSVELIQQFEPGYTHPGRGGTVVLCFVQPSPAAVDTLYAAITAAGFTGKKPPWDAFWGQRYACVVDPDGNQIDLFAAL
jgi:catechol 2,3-dioxygenase-like lactoylglutathione lyase family enzyme